VSLSEDIPGNWALRLNPNEFEELLYGMKSS